MENRIEVLGGALVDQIAAGEVVERPASVVKELLENAIDAEASSIRVDLEDGGRALVRIADDGVGMSPRDAALCVERHATSKIRSFEDLVRVRTLGFRGEALPSIASVSKFEILTRPRDAVAGTRVRIEGGGSPVVSSAGCAPGTVFEVRDLFYNLPARRKFLKARQTETRHILDTCLRVALAEPSLRLVVTQDGRPLRTYLPSLGLLPRAQSVLEEEALTALEGARDGVHVEAMLGRVEAAQRGPRRLFIFVNGRPVSDPKLARAVAFAYGNTLPPGRYPSGVVHLRVPSEDVDVNAHPRKAEVRFAHEREVLDALTRVLAQKLQTRAYVKNPDAQAFWQERLHPPPRSTKQGAGPLFDTNEPRPSTDPWGLGVALRDAAAPSSPRGAAATSSPRDAAAPTSSPRDAAAPTSSPRDAETYAPAASPTSSPSQGATAYGARATDGQRAGHRPYSPAAAGVAAALAAPPADVDGRSARKAPGEAPAPAPGFFGRLRYLGQVRHTFLVCEGDDALYFIDPTAADVERRLDGMRRRAAGEDRPSRRLLFPARVELAPDVVEGLEARRPGLLRLGFDCAALGPTTVALHALPLELGDADPEHALRAALPLAALSPHDEALTAGLRALVRPAALGPRTLLGPVEATRLLMALDEARGRPDAPQVGPPIVRTVPLPDLPG